METTTKNAAEANRLLEPIAPERVPELTEALARLGIGALRTEGLARYLGRNDNWVGSTEDGRRVFVKRLQGEAEESTARFERITAFEDLVSGARLHSWRTPEFLGADAATRIVAFSNIQDAVSGIALADEDAFDEALSRRAGRAIGELHSLPAEASETHQPRGGMANNLDALTAGAYARASGAELEAWALLQHDKELKIALQRLQKQTAAATRTPSHCDLRLDQFLLSGVNLYLADWEEFRLADPAMDIGSFVGEWLQRAAARMFADIDADVTATGGEVHEALMRKGEEELGAVRPRISAFWQGYREIRDTVDPQLAERSTAYAGWHLFDRLLAGAMFSAKLSGIERGTAGIGRNALINASQFVKVIGLEKE